MNITHDKQQAVFGEVFKSLTGLLAGASVHKEVAQKLKNNPMYSDGHNDKLLAKSLAEYQAAAAEIAANIGNSLERLGKNEAENASVFDPYDTKFVALVSLVGNGLPLSEELAKPLAGQHQVIKHIRALCKAKGLDDRELKPYDVDVINEINKITETVIDTKDPAAVMQPCGRISDMLTRIAPRLGVELTDEQQGQASAIREQFSTFSTRAGMGLPTE